MVERKKTLKKGGASTSGIIRNIVNRPISKEIGQMALKAVEHLPNGKKLNKEIITSIYPGDVHKKALKLYLDYATALTNKPKPKLPIGTEAKIAAATTGTAGLISGLIASVDTTRNQLTSLLSNKDTKLPVSPVKSSIAPESTQKSNKDTKQLESSQKSITNTNNYFKNIDMNKIDGKTAAYISSLVGVAIFGKMLYKKLTKQKITNQELELEKIVKNEQSTPSKSPKKKSLVKKIIKYGAIPLAGVMAFSRLNRTLKK